MRNAPAGYRGRGRVEGIGTAPRRTPEQQRDRAAAFGCKLEPARLGHLHPLGLANDRAERAVPESLLDNSQQLGIVAGFGVDHAGRLQPRLEKPRCKQVARPHHPEHVTPRSRGDACRKQDRCGLVTPAAPARGHLVQRVEPKPLVCQATVEQLDAERQNRPVTHVAFDRAQRRAQLGNRGNGIWHGDSQQLSFSICSKSFRAWSSRLPASAPPSAESDIMVLRAERRGWS